MAGFHTKTFLKHDDYMTPSYAWDNIKGFIPKDKVIWEAFYGDGKSGNHLKEIGFNVIHDKDDFFENDKGDIVVSNPPFTKVKEILNRLVELDKPFINDGNDLQNKCNFDCFYYCWKINLERDIIWLK